MTHIDWDRMTRHTNLACALEEHFGRSRTWPLTIRAAYTQVTIVEDLIGADQYAGVLDWAV